MRLYEQGKITAEEYAEEREKLGKSLEIRKKVKKKRSVRYKNVLIDQELGTEVKNIQQAYTDWKRTSERLKLADIGVTVKGHSKEGGKGSSSLFATTPLPSCLVKRTSYLSGILIVQPFSSFTYAGVIPLAYGSG